MTTKLFQDDYTRRFYSKVRGYPPILADGMQSHDCPIWLVQGVHIGDVMLRSDSGAIEYVGINVTRDADDPRNWQQLPKDFEPCFLEPGIDCIDPSRFPNPTVIGNAASPTADFRVQPIPPADDQDHWKAKFSTNAWKALSCTSSGRAKLQRMAMMHGAAFYYQVMNVDGLELQNGDLSVVTGCHKTSYWVTGLLSCGAASPRITKTLLVPKVEGGVAKMLPMIEDCLSETTPPSAAPCFQSARPDTASRLENEPACVAFQAFYISLKSSVYNDMREPRSLRQSIWHSLPRFLRPPMRTWPIHDSYTPPYHPCAAISNLIHSSNARVTTAVVHDEEIMSVLRKVRCNDLGTCPSLLISSG
ncbi:hypothetical protein CPB85DRAFT_1317621 [Mucidula mucida]|nr:hypothetical protein CPB85DRAFT_1317621 [Mucidula mucida]